MKLRQLESILQEVEVFDTPKVKYEQYPTTAHIAAHMLYNIHHTFNDIEGKSVLDLGVGCGILSIGAAILGSAFNVGVDIDPDAIKIARKNCEEFEVDVELMLCDVRNLPFRSSSIDNTTGSSRDSDSSKSSFDVVIMNPPFGTKLKGIDILFLETAFKHARDAVYSLHKTSTRDYVLKKAREFGAEGKVLAELRYNIPRMYSFHQKETVDIEVDFIRFDLAKRKSPAIPSPLAKGRHEQTERKKQPRSDKNLKRATKSKSEKKVE